MFNFFETLHVGLLDHFQSHPVIWWGGLALVAAGAIVTGYATAKRDGQAS